MADDTVGKHVSPRSPQSPAQGSEVGAPRDQRSGSDEREKGFLSELFAPVAGFGVSFSTMFRKVATDWPDSRKAPDALVKVGFTQAAQGKNAEARATLEDVTRRFPGSEAAQLASDRLKRLPAGR
jgi:hypothetical protein